MKKRRPLSQPKRFSIIWAKLMPVSGWILEFSFNCIVGEMGLQLSSIYIFFAYIFIQGLRIAHFFSYNVIMHLRESEKLVRMLIVTYTEIYSGELRCCGKGEIMVGPVRMGITSKS